MALKDYGRQLMLAQAAAQVAEDLYNHWNVPGDVKTRTIQFGTMTSREDMPMSFWKANAEEFFKNFIEGNLHATGMYSFERDKAQHIHVHFVVSLDVTHLEWLQAGLNMWHANTGFYKVEEARNLVRVASYTLKDFAQAPDDEVARVLIEEVVFFGDGWTSHAIEHVHSLPQLPVGGV